MRPWLFLSGELPDQVLLRLAVRRAVAVQNFVKPDLRLLQNVRPLPRIPRQVGLRFARDESPIDGPDLLLLGNRQNRVERAATERAIYSVQITGRLNRRSHCTSRR